MTHNESCLVITYLMFTSLCLPVVVFFFFFYRCLASEGASWLLPISKSTVCASVKECSLPMVCFFFAAELLRDMCRVIQSEMNCQTDNCSFSLFMRAFSLRVNVECGKATDIKSYVLLLSGTSVFDFKMDEVKMFGQLCIFLFVEWKK